MFSLIIESKSFMKFSTCDSMRYNCLSFVALNGYAKKRNRTAYKVFRLTPSNFILGMGPFKSFKIAYQQFQVKVTTREHQRAIVVCSLH